MNLIWQKSFGTVACEKIIDFDKVTVAEQMQKIYCDVNDRSDNFPEKV